MTIDQPGTYPFAGRDVKRLGYGAMQLAGPGAFGPPRDRDAALAVLRAAIEAGVDHIDTSDFYGPHVTNRLIREALSPYPQDLVIVTKIGARRGEDASWLPAFEPDDLARAVDDNLANLGLEALDVVNLRLMFDAHGPAEGSLAAPLRAVADLQGQGLVRHIGLSNVTPTQFAEARDIAGIVCVQNRYNLAHRDDDAFIDALAKEGVAYVPFFRSAASARSSRRRFPTWRRGSTRRRCRWRSPGCFNARPTSCRSPARRRWRISARTSPPHRWRCPRMRWPRSTRSVADRVGRSPPPAHRPDVRRLMVAAAGPPRRIAQEVAAPARTRLAGSPGQGVDTSLARRRKHR